MANESLQLEWKDCPCGSCKRSYPVNLGTFYDGSGFDPDERVLLDRAFATLSSSAVAGGEEADDEKPRYTTKRLRHEIARARENDARELDQLRDRVKELEKALDGMLVPFEGDPCRKDHHGYCQSHFLEEDCCVAIARRVREGGKVDG